MKLSCFSRHRFRMEQRKKITDERTRRKNILDQYLSETRVGDTVTSQTTRLLREYQALLDYLIHNPEM